MTNDEPIPYQTHFFRDEFEGSSSGVELRNEQRGTA